jgi:hypothetical protein
MKTKSDVDLDRSAFRKLEADGVNLSRGMDVFMTVYMKMQPET